MRKPYSWGIHTPFIRNCKRLLRQASRSMLFCCEELRGACPGLSGSSMILSYGIPKIITTPAELQSIFFKFH